MRIELRGVVIAGGAMQPLNDDGGMIRGSVRDLIGAGAGRTERRNGEGGHRHHDAVETALISFS
jgi:hypothetical protein